MARSLPTVKCSTGATTFSITTLGVTTFRITTLGIKGLFATLSKTTIYIECHYAESRTFYIVMLNVVMLSVVAPLHLGRLWPQILG